MITYFKDILVGFWSLLAGMAVTIRYFVKPIVTVQYPRQKLVMSPRYRGHIEFIIDPETATHRCIACEMCARICPSQLIEVGGVKLDAKKKVPFKHVIEYYYCSLCGLCLESCPTHALQWSHEYLLANYRREDSVIDLLTRLQDQQRAAGLPVTPIPEPKPEEEAAPEKPPAEKPAPPRAKAPAAEAPPPAPAEAPAPEPEPGAPAPESPAKEEKE